MSLNKYELAIYDYWGRSPEEQRHWRMKVRELGATGNSRTETACQLERELWAYLMERSPHVPALCPSAAGPLPRVSLLNLAEHILRLWGPPTPLKPQSLD